MKTFLKLLVGLFFMLFSFFSQAESDLISPKEASALYADKQAVIIDVREDDEWQAGHIQGAIHIPLKQLPERLAELQTYKDKPVITQCRSGRRSLEALDILKKSGFKSPRSMEGGLQAWTQQGFATTQ